jgi:PII-like signaling protein
VVDDAKRIEPLLPEIATLISTGALTVTPVRLFVADGAAS